jgi:hypothetical protein
MPNMKPIMNPPPVITLGIENTIISIPHAFLFSGFLRNIIAADNIIAPHIDATIEIVMNGTVALLSDPGSVGKIQGKYAPATPTAIALQTIKNPAIRDKREAPFDFSIWLISDHSRAFFASSLVHFRISAQSRKS